MKCFSIASISPMSWKIWENIVRHPYHCTELFVCRIPIPPTFYEENTFSSFPGLGIRENLVCCHPCSFLLYAGIQHRQRFLKSVAFGARVVSRKLCLPNHQPWLLPGMDVFMLWCTILFEGCLVLKRAWTMKEYGGAMISAYEFFYDFFWKIQFVRSYARGCCGNLNKYP